MAKDPNYAYDQRPPTSFTPEAQTVLAALRERDYAVLVGPNNCGKSYILRSITQGLGMRASYLGPSRYQNFNLLGYFTPDRNRKQNRFNIFMNHWGNQSQNIDNSPLNLQEAIAELSDQQRTRLQELIRLLLKSDMEILHTVANNSMSQKYISVTGHNISYTSSGFRLIVTLLTSLLDEEYDTFLVDEPELGISPEAQGILADFLFDREHREKYFAHIRTLILATHSTIFLDRKSVSNNFAVAKEGDKIHITPILSVADFQRIHFFLLGNRLETLWLPSLIVFVEGQTDHAFIEHVLALKFPDFQISVILGGSDGQIKNLAYMAKSILGDIQKSPYRDRIVVVLDSVHGADIVSRLVAIGIQLENIVIWPRNGIEYYYPPEAMNQIFPGAESDIVIDNDRVIRNGLTYTKAELAAKVNHLVTSSMNMSKDFDERFMSLVAKRIGVAYPAGR
jgi:predicted ATPase